MFIYNKNKSDWRKRERAKETVANDFEVFHVEIDTFNELT